MNETADQNRKLGRTHAESTPWFERRPLPPNGSPNVVFVVLDDVGYSDLSCFGSEIETRNFDALARRGLRYSNFHATTLCSPTRACLLTGRNHHSVGMRYLANVDMGWPSGRGAISHRAATIAEILRDTGYSTFAVGKWHLAPTEDASAAGPFDQWPLGRGFERFYGFMNGGTDQFHPELVEDNHLTDPPTTPEEGYHLSADLVDRAISYLSNQISLTPEKPFFLHFCFGAGHFPHQAPAQTIEKYRGRFAHGWDVERERRLAKQKAMGLVPADTDLPERNPGVAAWDDISPEHKRVAERFEEVYAGFLDYTDQQFGRFIDFLAEVGRLDNTMIVLISDNGASVDTGPDGTSNVLKWFNQIPDSADANLAVVEELGSETSAVNYPWGWAQASNTPLKLYKSFTHGGGVRVPMIVSWPARAKNTGQIRPQFHHAIDITPTVLEVCGLNAPETYRGIAQLPIHGTSFAYTFDDPSAPTRKTTQYFEMYGHRSIWHKGWKAVTKHDQGSSFETEKWELYDLDHDFSEAHDLAETETAKLREMKERWWAEAGKYDVMPLDDRNTLFKPNPKPGSIRGRDRFEYFPPLDAIPAEAAPLTQDVSHRIEVDLSRAGTTDGPLIAFGNIHGGYALFIAENRLVYAYNHVGEISQVLSETELPSGNLTVSFEFTKTGELKGRGRLIVGDRPSGEIALEKTLIRHSLSPLRIGRASRPPVSPLMTTEIFHGDIHRVVFQLGVDRGLVPDTLDID